MSGLNVEPFGSAAITRSRYAIPSAVVRTGGMRFGLRMARPKGCAVDRSVALSISPSRPCRWQSSGLRMVTRSGIARSRRAVAGNAAEHGAGHQAGAARIVEIEDAADQLAGGVEAGDRVHVAVDHLAGVGIDAHAAEREADAAADLV